MRKCYKVCAGGLSKTCGQSEADFNFCLWPVLRCLGCKRKYHWDRKLNFEIIISLEHSQGINNKYKTRIKMQIIH